MSPRRVLSAILLASAALGLTACGPEFEKLYIDGVVTSSSVPGSINVSRVTVPEGAVLKAHIIAKNDDQEDMETRVETKNGRILGVSSVVTPNDYAFYGITAGETEVDVLAEGRVVLIIKAVVVPQPTTPQ